MPDGAGITSIASATSTAIGASVTRDVSITGTTTITSFDTVAAGTYREGVFTGILTLTYNATSLILPGAANITTAAGDTFGAQSLGSGNWRVLWYQPASGKAVAPSGGFTLLGTLTTTSGTTQALTGLTLSAYKALFLNVNNVSFSGGGGTLNLALGSGATPTYGSTVAVATVSGGSVPVVGGIWVYGINSTSQQQVVTPATSNSSSGVFATAAKIATGTAAVVNAVRAAGGTFNAGSIDIYGVT